MEKLRNRNAQLIRECKDLTGIETLRNLWYKGLSTPLSVNERKMRQRIRDKAYIAIADLALAQCAGVIPDKKALKKGILDIVDLVSEIKSAMLLQMVVGQDKL